MFYYYCRCQCYCYSDVVLVIIIVVGVRRAVSDKSALDGIVLILIGAIALSVFPV